MKLLYTLVFLGLTSILSLAQVNTGLILDNDTKTPVISDFSGAKFGASNIPPKTDLRQFAPEPQDQGELPSCVGWSVGYAALTIMAAQNKEWVNQNIITNQAFSPHFIYNQLVEDKNCLYAGASFPSAFQLLKSQGICKKTTFNLENEECSVLPTDNDKEEAKENRIKDYYQLFMKNASVEDKIKKVRISLAEGYPVVVGMFLTPNFRDFEKGDIFWKPQENVDRSELYPHAMVVVGYNDISKSFEVMNSWGSDWGDGGFVKVKYKDFAKHCVLAYQLHLPENGELLDDKKPSDPFAPFVQAGSNIKHGSKRGSLGRPEKIELHGDFVFRYPTEMVGDEILFNQAAVELKGNYYSLKKKDWEIGQLFQLVAKNIKKNRYVYVFSIDGNENATLHWPKSRLYASNTVDDKKQKFGYTESPLVPYNAAEIVIPGEKSALQKEVGGDDYLFVLYSYNLLEDIDDIIENVRNSSLPMHQRLEAVLGNDLIPYSEVQFDENKISAKTNAKNGIVLGVMIESKGE